MRLPNPESRWDIEDLRAAYVGAVYLMYENWVKAINIYD